MKYKVGDILSVREKRTSFHEASHVTEYFLIRNIDADCYKVKRHSGGTWYNFHGEEYVDWYIRMTDRNSFSDIDIIGVKHKRSNIKKLMEYIND